MNYQKIAEELNAVSHEIRMEIPWKKAEYEDVKQLVSDMTKNHESSKHPVEKIIQSVYLLSMHRLKVNSGAYRKPVFYESGGYTA